jgi:hypothetical protein
MGPWVQTLVPPHTHTKDTQKTTVRCTGIQKQLLSKSPEETAGHHCRLNSLSWAKLLVQFWDPCPCHTHVHTARPSHLEATTLTHTEKHACTCEHTHTFASMRTHISMHTAWYTHTWHTLPFAQGPVDQDHRIAEPTFFPPPGFGTHPKWLSVVPVLAPGVHFRPIRSY